MICAATEMWHIVFVVDTELTLSLIYDIHLLSAFGFSSSSHLLVTTGFVGNAILEGLLSDILNTYFV